MEGVGAVHLAIVAVENVKVWPQLRIAAAADRVTRLRRLWRGELTLTDAFWIWVVVGGLLVNGITTFLFLILIWADRPIEALLVGSAFSVPYNIVAAVGVCELPPLKWSILRYGLQGGPQWQERGIHPNRRCAGRDSNASPRFNWV